MGQTAKTILARIELTTDQRDFLVQVTAKFYRVLHTRWLETGTTQPMLELARATLEALLEGLPFSQERLERALTGDNSSIYRSHDK